MEFRVLHESTLDEAGKPRTVQAEVSGIAFETQARLLAGAKLNTELRLQGFLAAKSKRSKKLVLHVTEIEFVEGEKQDAPAAQR